MSEPTPNTQPVSNISTFETVKMVIALVFKMWNVFSNLAKDKTFTDFVNDLDAATTELKNAKTLNDRVDAATKLSRIARRL